MKLVAILALVLTIPAASAASLAYTPSGGLTTVCYGLTCGTTFQALQPMTVTGLATFGGNFFSYSNTPSPVTVGLWDDQGQLLASAEVNNDFRVHHCGRERQVRGARRRLNLRFFRYRSAGQSRLPIKPFCLSKEA